MDYQAFKRLLLQHCNYKLTGEGTTVEILENVEKDYDMEKLSNNFDVSGLHLKLVFEEATRDKLSMGRVFSLALFVAGVCKKKGSIDAAYELLDWLDNKCCIAGLYELFDK